MRSVVVACAFSHAFGFLSPAVAQETAEDLANWCAHANSEEMKPEEFVLYFGCIGNVVATYAMMAANCSSVDNGFAPDPRFSAGVFATTGEDAVNTLIDDYMGWYEANVEIDPSRASIVSLLAMANAFSLAHPCEALQN